MIGFEFETSDLVVKAPANTLAMHVPFLVGTGWGLYLDVMLSRSSHTGNASSKFRTWGDVEFVVDAVEESSGLDSLNTTFREIEQFIANLLKAKSWTSKDVLLHKVNFGPGVTWSPQALGARKEDRELITIEIHQKVVTAAPQVSAGIKLGALLPLIQYMGREVKVGDFRLDFLGKARSDFRQKLYAASAALASTAELGGSFTPLQQQEYQGVVAQLTDVIVWARLLKDIEHEKYLTPLLSRTNYGLYPDFIRTHRPFKQDVIERAAILLDKAAGITLDRADPFLCKSTPQPSALSVGQWLQHIIMDEDPLFWGQKRGDPRWNPQLVGPSSNRGWGTVFEFRGIAEGLPSAQWKTFATARLPFIAGLNGDVRTLSGVNLFHYGARYTGPGIVPAPPPPPPVPVPVPVPVVEEDSDIEWGEFQGASSPVPRAPEPPPTLVRRRSLSGVAPAPRLLRTHSLPTLPSASRKDG